MNAQHQGSGGRGQGSGKTVGKTPIAPRQIKAIHAAIHKAGLDDDAYRGLLLVRYNVNSCKQLTWRQAEELLDHLNNRIPGTRNRYMSPQFDDMDGRPGFATGSQCRLIAAMFAQISRVPVENLTGRERALDGFCARILNVAGLRMVRSCQVEKIVKALEAMGAVKKEGNHGSN